MKITRILSIFVLIFALVLSLASCDLFATECTEHVDEDGNGKCDVCDLDPSKICDNCMKCMGDEVDFRAITIAGIQLENENDAEL